MNVRQTTRRERHYAVVLESGSRTDRVGVTRNVSAQGLLVNTPSHFAVGESLKVAVFGQTPHPSLATGRVVRVEETPHTSTEPWRYRLAVALDTELPLLAS